MRMLNLSGLGIVLLLASCSTTRYCTGEQAYQRTEVLPPLKGTEALQVPEAQSALRVPKGRGTSDGFAETYINAEGESELRCLDMPPRLSGA